MSEEKGLRIVEKENFAYQCNFCKKVFEKASQCAKHIEKKSGTGMCFPSDIKTIDISKDLTEEERKAFLKRKEVSQAKGKED